MEGWLPWHETRTVTKFSRRPGYIQRTLAYINTHIHIAKNASICIYTCIRIPLVATWCPQPVIIVLGGGLMMSDERPPAICLFHHSEQQQEKKKKKKR